MMKKLLAASVLFALAISANAQQFKIGRGIQSNVTRLSNPSTMSVIDTMKPASVMTGGCAVSTNTVVNGLWNYINDRVAPYDSGYIFGTGIIPISGTVSTSAQELGQKYTVTGAATVTDVLILAGVAKGGTVTATAKIYSENSTTHKPNTQIGSSSVPVTMATFTVGNYTAFHFGTPVNVSAGKFFAAITVPAFGTADHDTLSVLCTRLGACPAAGSDSASAIKLATYGWYLVKTAFGQNGDLMIFPVVNMTTGVSNVTKGNLSLYAASPNPAVNSIDINFSLDSPSKVEIEVYDLTGKMVKSIKNNDIFSNGKHAVSIDLSSLESGTYMYSVYASGNKMFSKFVVTK